MTTCFLIPGKPRGKERPRFNSATKTTYTPPATVAYERTVKYSYLSSTQAGERMHSGPVRVEIDAVFTVPTAWRVSKKKRALAGAVAPENKPDCDNIAKAILDALNGIAYKDDSQVAYLVVRKRFGEKPFCTVRIESGGYGNDTE
nr:MAG TPA: Endodeoxyribonuclease RusA [Caudoviricetes sp.]